MKIAIAKTFHEGQRVRVVIEGQPAFDDMIITLGERFASLGVGTVDLETMKMMRNQKPVMIIGK